MTGVQTCALPIFTVTVGGFLLVQTLQGAVMPFVQFPVALHRQPDLAEVREGQMTCHDSAGEKRGVGDVEPQPGVGQRDAGCGSLGFALCRQGNVVPPGEEVQLIPGGLTVAEKD